jgi:ABC-type lipoprotein release transport system permease subunit
MIGPSERHVVVIEREAAHAWKTGLGQSITLTRRAGGPRTELTVVGIFDSRRVAEFQVPSVYLPIVDLQGLTGEAGVASAIDVKLRDPSPEALAAAKTAVEECISARKLPYPYRVETAAARQLVLSEAERITRMLLMLIAFVAMLTSFFIILTTQSVSLVQRQTQLGIMRCVGATRGQLAALLFSELAPLGLLGTIAGILAGIAVAHLAAYASTDVSFRVYLSPWGIALAAGSGLATTLLSTLLLIVQIGRVTPLEAVNPQARPARLGVAYIVAALGVALLVLHQWMVFTPERTRWLHAPFAMAGVGSLHMGYALIVPVLVIWLGRPIARLVGWLLGLPAKLAEEPFTRAPWRSTGACWVLMVGLSLIVYIAVRAEGVLAIWDFPARLPATFVWSSKYVPGDVIERVRELPGVGASTTCTDVECEIRKAGAAASRSKGSLVERFLRKLTRPVFVAGDPYELPGMIKLVFTAGDPVDAAEKLKRGGYVTIPPQTARNLDLTVGDRVTVTIKGRSADFEVAGVVQSPALDLAVTAFQAESYMQFAAASAILGTQQDLKEKFGLDVVSMFMCDVDLPAVPPPDDFDPLHLPDFTSDAAVASTVLSWADSLSNERDTLDRIGPTLREWLDGASEASLPADIRAELRRFGKSIRRLAWDSATQRRTREENWDTFRERLVLLKIAQEMDRPDAIMGSLRQLKKEVGSSLKRAIVVITWLPSIVLAAAAIGIGNLMMVSVQLRARQIAVLRAVGAQKSQIIRLVLTEAITLGLLGSVIGVALGLHEAYSVNHIAANLTDIVVTLEFIVPVGTVALSVALTVTVCLLAAIAPDRYAARTNIIAAMQTT